MLRKENILQRHLLESEWESTNEKNNHRLHWRGIQPWCQCSQQHIVLVTIARLAISGFWVLRKEVKIVCTSFYTLPEGTGTCFFPSYVGGDSIIWRDADSNWCWLMRFFLRNKMEFSNQFEHPVDTTALWTRWPIISGKIKLYVWLKENKDRIKRNRWEMDSLLSAWLHDIEPNTADCISNSPDSNMHNTIFRNSTVWRLLFHFEKCAENISIIISSSEAD